MNKNLLVVLGIIIGVALLVSTINYMAPAALQSQKNVNLANTNDNNGVVNIGLAGGNYNPRTINLEYGKPVTFRNDGTLGGCANYLMQPELGIKTNFAQNKEFTFTPQKKGSFVATCSMGMYRTTINVA